MKLTKRGTYYYFRHYINGKQRWCNTHETDYSAAKVFMDDFVSAKNKSLAKTPSGRFNIETLRWSDFCDKFMTFSRFNKAAPESDERVIRAIDSVLKPQLFKDLSADNIRKYINYRKKIDGLKDNSVNRDLHSIKSMWRFAVTELFDSSVRNEASLVREIPTEKQTKTKYFTEEEIERILSGSKDKKITILCYLMLYLGLRLKEACLLEWKDVLFEKDSVRVFPQKTKHTNPNPSFVPLNHKLKAFLQGLPRKDKYIVGSNYSSRRELNSLSSLIGVYFKSLGIEGSAHTCRHTFISHLIMKGVDGSVVQRWARIKKPEILQVYLHLSPKYNNEAINLLPY